MFGFILKFDVIVTYIKFIIYVMKSPYSFDFNLAPHYSLRKELGPLGINALFKLFNPIKFVKQSFCILRAN